MRRVYPLRYAVLLLTSISISNCQVATGQEVTTVDPDSKQFKSYWYAGEAELNRYKLDQARYGEVHQGEAVLIFVTEEFRSDRQVKYEGGDRKNVVPILKMNATRKFYTGLYPYSIMSSVFTPTDPAQQTLKTTTSSQEWCGHTFSQLNLRKNKYQVQVNSYFQSEGDRELQLPKAMLEDELWTKIRLQPASLPTGKVQMIPGEVFLRLRHLEHALHDAEATMTVTEDESLSDQLLQTYSVRYPELGRSLSITFESAFPHGIVAWEEETISGLGANATTLRTRAIRTHLMKSAYWGKNGTDDAYLREELGLGSGLE
ncbi:MAG: septum formation inhibitor Maf [Bacteroidota bacterium]